MREKTIDKAAVLIEKIVDREYDHSDLQGRKVLRERLNKKPTSELEEIWERGEDG